jgi:hypothetical protein
MLSVSSRSEKYQVKGLRGYYMQHREVTGAAVDEWYLIQMGLSNKRMDPV